MPKSGGSRAQDASPDSSKSTTATPNASADRDPPFLIGYEAGYDDGTERNYGPTAAHEKYLRDCGEAGPSSSPTPDDAVYEAACLLVFARTKIEEKLAGPVARWFNDTAEWLDKGCDCERFEGGDHGRLCASRVATAHRKFRNALAVEAGQFTRVAPGDAPKGGT